jgi:hypothetical protein
MSHPPPYTFRMKNKNKVSLCSKPITCALSLTPPFHTQSLRGSEVLSQCKRPQLRQEFPEPIHVCQLPRLPFEISNLKFAIPPMILPSTILPYPPLIFLPLSFRHFRVSSQFVKFVSPPSASLHLRVLALDFPILTVTNAN